MTLQTTGPISLVDIRGEFGGTAPDSVSEYVDKVGKTASAGQLVAFSEYYGLSNGPSGVLFHTLNDPNPYGTSTEDHFGNSIDISGNYCIVGASNEDDAGGSSSGKAYIFDVSTGNLLHTLNNPNAYGTSENDSFGRSVAISGNYCIVGASGESNATGTSLGKAYIFDVSTGNLLHILNNPLQSSSTHNDFFGYAVAISGNKCVVGAKGKTVNGGVSAGGVYIFSVDTGSLLHAIDDPNNYSTETNDQFGSSIAISNSYCVVGALGEKSPGSSYVGIVYIFDNSTGNLLHTIHDPNAYGNYSYDFFGSFCDITDNYCIVGSPNEDDAGGSSSGKAYIFDVSTGNLLHTLDNPNAYGTSENDYFGNSVGISNSFCVVGAPSEGDASGNYSGKVYIFDVSTGNLLHTLDNPNAYGTSENDHFGAFSAISGNYIIVGAWAEDDAGGTDSGKAYIFK